MADRCEAISDRLDGNVLVSRRCLKDARHSGAHKFLFAKRTTTRARRIHEAYARESAVSERFEPSSAPMDRMEAEVFAAEQRALGAQTFITPITNTSFFKVHIILPTKAVR